MVFINFFKNNWIEEINLSPFKDSWRCMKFLPYAPKRNDYRIGKPGGQSENFVKRCTDIQTPMPSKGAWSCCKFDILASHKFFKAGKNYFSNSNMKQVMRAEMRVFEMNEKLWQLTHCNVCIARAYISNLHIDKINTVKSIDKFSRFRKMNQWYNWVYRLTKLYPDLWMGIQKP